MAFLPGGKLWTGRFGPPPFYWIFRQNTMVLGRGTGNFCLIIKRKLNIPEIAIIF
jgi:hypothetical protein